MKTDTQLQRDISDELAWAPSIHAAEIGVSVKDGVVTLTGTVDSLAQRHAAEQVLERVRGVRAYADDLAVRPPSWAAHTDTDIARAIADALAWNIEVPAERVRAKVVDGWVTLEGTVDWQFQKRAAAKSLRYLKGIHGVTNDIAVLPPSATSYELGQQIKDALRRSAELDADRITVASTDGQVVLTGTVRSYAERRDAEDAAWAAPGVTDVENRISVEP